MADPEKLDLYRQHKADYAAPKTPVLVNLKPAVYLTVTGRGGPGGEVFSAKIGALYGVAYTAKFASKFAGRDYGVCKLEGLWWGSSKKADFSKEPHSQWNWKLLIRTPDFIKAAQVKAAIKTLLDKGKPPEVSEVKRETIREGRCVQMLHIGPYDREGETIAKMRCFAEQNGLSFRGLHHEIYLNDPRRVPPERIRTILRMPVG